MHTGELVSEKPGLPGGRPVFPNFRTSFQVLVKFETVRLHNASCYPWESSPEWPKRAPTDTKKEQTMIHKKKDSEKKVDETLYNWVIYLSAP